MTMQITWTKCSERMPPDDVKQVICRSRLIPTPTRTSSLVLIAYALEAIARDVEWMPYSEEIWKELNNG